MARISVGDAIGAGFSLIGRRPLSVLLWGFVQAAMGAINLALTAPYNLALFSQALRNPGHPPPAANIEGFAQYQLLSYALSALALFVGGVLYCAVFRSVIHPSQSRYGSMRLGATEFALFVIIIGEFIAFFITLLLTMLIAGIFLAILVALKAAVATAVLAFVIGAGCVVLAVYVALRLSMIGPMMVDDGRIRLGDAWRMTKGNVGSLLGIAGALLLILFSAEVVALIAIIIIALTMLSSSVGGWPAIQAMLQRDPAAIIPFLGPVGAVLFVVVTPLYGAALAVMTAPWARAYLDLRPDPAEAF